MAKLNMKTLAAELAELRAQITKDGTVTPEIPGAAKAAEERQGLQFASVNLGKVTGRYDTEGTMYVTAHVTDGEMAEKWIGLIFFKSRTFVNLSTGMFMRVGLSFRHGGTMPAYNVGWAELRGFKGMGFKAGVMPVVSKPV